MLSRSPIFTAVMLAACIVLVVANTSPRSHPSGPVETMPRISAPAEPPAEGAPDSRPPQPGEMASTLVRVFGEGDLFQDARGDQAMTGDFNGDGSPDLAVPARPRGDRLATLNSELANWFAADPSTPIIGADGKASRYQATMSEDDHVLIVVHGIGAAGWRHPEARQAYVLKLPATVGRLELLPRRRRDFVYDSSRHQFLYWTGGRYAWHDSHGLAG